MRRAASLVALVLAAAACRGEAEPLPDTSDWWSDAGAYDVQEPVRFTEEAYGDLPNTLGDFIDDVFPTTDVLYAPGDGYDDNSCSSKESRELPVEIDGIVTLHPRWYMKIDGCNRGEEKYYGNWFIEDDTGGLFVIGDTKVAHFDMGDRVKIRVRAVRTNFGMDMIYAHDVLEIHREARPIRYRWAQDGLDADDVGEVRRVRGQLTAGPDTFGQLVVETDEGSTVFVNLDAELSRRRQYPPVGVTMCATGPVQYSFSEYSINIMRVGQLAVVEGDEACPD